MDVVRFHLEGSTLELSKVQLAQQAAFFAPLVDEAGAVDYGSSELQCLMSPLCPAARQVLPRLLRWLGSGEDDEIFSEKFLLHSFAVAHLLGANEVMEAARRRAACHEGRLLVAAIASLDVKEDRESLRTAAEYGLDRYSCMALVHAAAEADMAEVVRILVSLEDGEQPKEPSSVDCTVDVLDAKGRTALHVCAIRDSANVAKVLLEFSASLTALCDPPEMVEDAEVDESLAPSTAGRQSSKGVRTALHLAAYHDSAEVLQLLLDARANVASCVKGIPGALTPLHECASCDAVRCAELLAPRAREAAEAASVQLEEALQGAMEVDQDAAAQPTDEPQDVSEVQWSRFLDPLQAKLGHHGSSPLHLAAESDSPGVVRALLRCTANPQLGDDQGDTALHCAVLYGSPKALQALLDGGAMPCENVSGELPLHLMAEFGPGGDECDLPPQLEKRHFARSMRAQEVLLEALHSKGLLTAALAHKASGDMQNTPLHAVVRNDHMGAQHAVRLLAKARADLEAQNEEGRTPLSLSMRRYGRTGKVCQLLTELGAKEPAEPAATLVGDLAGALGGYLRPLVPPVSQPETVGSEMEVDGVQLPIESQSQ